MKARATNRSSFLPTLDAVQVECHHLTGNDAFLLKVVLASMTELEDLIEKLLPTAAPPPAWSSLRHLRESVRFASNQALVRSFFRTSCQH